MSSWQHALATLATVAGPVAEPPPAPPPVISPSFQMECWQNGVLIVSERAIDAYRLEEFGLTVTKTDGSRLTLFLGTRTPAALCLLRLPAVEARR